MSTHHQLLYHVVFSTKHRRKLLTKDTSAKIYAYMAGICQDLGGFAIIVNGHLDHVHLLVRIPARMSVSEFIGKLKANTSKHVNEERWTIGAFHWQDGYGAFTVSVSNKDAVYDYIINQVQHHTRRTFEDEYLLMLQHHEVDFDPQYAFD